ncbi:MAG: SDR family NAD(P)-dependent oxidoreductase [Gemmatimonadales bacterium]|nr:MAG: SDR family NAD(P)-dependent oxidoreductase [Gemmatimonadales bacterium]
MRNPTRESGRVSERAMAKWTDTLKERVTLVTGGSGGLGRGVVKVLLEAGARLHIPIYADDEIPALEAFLGNGFSALNLHSDVDLTDESDVTALFDAIREAEGHGPDAVVNLAGGFAMSPIEETGPGVWDRMWRMNATTAFLVSRAAFPEMKSRGHGRIVNVSALPALDRGQSGLTAYGAAKAAVLNLTQTLSREGVEHGITVNAVLPSIIDTPGNREAMPDADRHRWLDPVEIGRVVRSLLSDEAQIVNGAAIPLTLGPS